MAHRYRSFMLAAFLLGACEEEKKPEVADAGAEDAGAKELGGRLGQAVRAAASSDAGTAAPSDQPPASGVFGPGEADRALAADAPPKIEVFQDGADPKIQLAAHAPSAEEKLKLVLLFSSGGQPFPPLDLSLVVAPEGAKKDDKDQPTTEPKKDEPAPTGPPRIVVRIAEAKLAGQGGKAPKEVADLIGKLKDSKISFTLEKSGPKNFARELTKDADKNLDIPLRALEDTLASVYVPAPDKPVGEGAYWMVTDRRASLGVNVVRYRVFKIAKINGDTAIMTVDLKQYAADGKIDLPLGKELESMTVGQYAVQAKANVELTPKHLFPTNAQYGIKLSAGLNAPGSNNADPNRQRPMLQMEVQSQIGDKELFAPQ
jgi:hypothetical protein